MLRLAWRNVWRNRRRSLINAASMAFGLAAIMFGQSLMRSLQSQLVEKSTGSITGQIQIQDPRVEQMKMPDRFIKDPAPIAAAVARDPRVLAGAGRITLTSLISTPQTSVGVLVVAVDPAVQERITDMSRYVSSGRYLSGGKDLYLGDKLARRLDLRLGEKAVIMAQAADGSLGADVFRLVGTFHTASESFDNSIAYVPLPAFQALLGRPGQINNYVLKLKDLDQVDAVRDSLESALKGRPVRVLTWKDIDHEILGVEQFQDAILDVVLVVVFAIVALGILNTQLMSLFERVREFGVLMSIGARPRWILRLILTESALLGAVGVAAGTAVGAALIWHFGRAGLPLPVGQAFSYFLPFPSVIYLRPSWGAHAFACAAVFAIALLSALPPALRAARLKPAEALRHV
ncbi:MAG: ABC transporter permease [Elusimicrobia bacterium]|nr:ABC transporter permease [Elusimicrobiota bacterium]